VIERHIDRADRLAGRRDARRLGDLAAHLRSA
jgi:hypothetical protein